MLEIKWAAQGDEELAQAGPRRVWKSGGSWRGSHAFQWRLTSRDLELKRRGIAGTDCFVLSEFLKPWTLPPFSCHVSVTYFIVTSQLSFGIGPAQVRIELRSLSPNEAYSSRGG